MSIRKNHNRGISILGALFWGLVIILVLSYFNLSLKTLVENPTTQDNIEYIKESSNKVWEAYLEEPVTHIWDNFIKELFWKPFILNMQRMRDGQPTDIELLAPGIPPSI